MTDRVRTLNLSFKTEEYIENEIQIGRSIVSTIQNHVGDGREEDVVLHALSEDSERVTRGKHMVFHVKTYRVSEPPVDVYEEVLDAVKDDHNEKIRGAGFSVQEEYEKAEKENEEDE